MQYVNLGKTGLIVSRMSFGAMTFGHGLLVGELVNNIDQKAADQMVATALEAGVNFFDTADGYTSGQSEIMLGRALEEHRHEVVIATKCGFRSGTTLLSAGLSYRYMLQAIEASLRRLGTDYVDLFYLHIPDAFTPLEETARALEDIVSKGMARYVGYSNFPAWQAQKLLDLQSHQGQAKIICGQMYYSLLGREIEFYDIPFMQANNVGLVVWSPLAGGFLSGKYTRENPAPDESRRAKLAFPPVEVEKGYQVVAQLIEIAKDHQATPAQIAIAWLLAKPVVDSVIIGANKMYQLEDNLQAVKIKLSADEIQRLDAVSALPTPYPAWMQSFGIDAKIKAALA